MPAVTAAWVKVATNANQFALQNTGGPLVLAQVVVTAGAAPTAIEGFKLEANEVFALSGLAGHDLYVIGPNGPSTYWLQHDGT